jgi:hypothetical protein
MSAIKIGVITGQLAGAKTEFVSVSDTTSVDAAADSSSPTIQDIVVGTQRLQFG